MVKNELEAPIHNLSFFIVGLVPILYLAHNHVNNESNWLRHYYALIGVVLCQTQGYKYDKSKVLLYYKSTEQEKIILKKLKNEENQEWENLK